MVVSLLCRRLKTSLADPVIRARALTLLGGKMIGLALLLAVMKMTLGSAVYAADGPTPEVNAVNTLWVLLAAFLVFCMQVGFVMLEAGFARSRESINILVEGIVDTCICGVTFWAWGFAFMFEPGQRRSSGPAASFSTDCLIRTAPPASRCWRTGCSSSRSPTPARPSPPARWSAAAGSWGDILYSIGVTGFIYPIIGHWAWGPTAGWR